MEIALGTRAEGSKRSVAHRAFRRLDLTLGKIEGFRRWQASQTVLSFPKRTPDGLLDVTFADRDAPDPFVIEIESYPQADTPKQLRDDAAMVLLMRGVLPDILLVILAPKGNQSIESDQVLVSAHGLAELRLKIRVIKMWELDAQELLALNDVGVVPYIPLAKYSGSPAALLQQCKERIETQAKPQDQAGLLATTQVMAEIRYNDMDLLSVFGSTVMSLREVYENSPSLTAFIAEKNLVATRGRILHILSKRFQSVPADLSAQVNAVDSQAKLDTLFDLAIDCADLEAFRVALSQSA